MSYELKMASLCFGIVVVLMIIVIRLIRDINRYGE